MLKTISNWQPKVKIENEHIKQVSECKTLGVTVDQHLSWKSNTENICKKITSGISALRRVNKHSYRFTTQLFAHTSITAVKYGMYLVKLNLKGYKNSKTELLD